MIFFSQLLKNKNLSQLLIIICLGLGAFFRLWNFQNNLQFLGDQGRDAIVAKHILIDHDIALIGPVTSTGNMYLGPLYYYFMVPFLWMSYPSPIGPAYAVAALSILTIALVYYLGKELVGERAAIIAMIMVTFSQTFIYFARFSWNPNPSPLVSTLLVWATYKAVTKRAEYWILVGLFLGILVQLHYITLLCVPAAGLIWLNQAFSFKRKSWKDMKTFLLSSCLSVFLFVASFAPLIAFDFRHHFLNSQSFIHFMFADLGPNQSSLIDKMRLITTRTFLRTNQTLFQEFVWSNIVASTGFIGIFIGVLIHFWSKQKSKPVGIAILSIYLAISILGLGYYRGAIFNHYFVYLLPMVMLLWGVVLDQLYQTKMGRFVTVTFAVLFIFWNVSNYTFYKSLPSITQFKQVSDSILSRVKPNEKYNIVLLTGTGDIEGQNYRYFLETSQNPPLTQDKWGDVNTLFIINEDHKIKRVIDSPIYEIVVFPNKIPTEIYTIPGGPEITVLRR